MSTLTLTGMIADLKASLLESSGKFPNDNTAFQRHLELALLDLARLRPRKLRGTLALVADQDGYAAPTDLIRPCNSTWGGRFKAAHKPWEDGYPESLPRLSVAEQDGVRMLWLTPAPTAMQIAKLGSDYPYFYLACHQLSDTPSDTTLPDAARGLLLLRAQAEAMKELSVLGVTKPVQLHHGMGSMSANGTPIALYERLMTDFEKAAA